MNDNQATIRDVFATEAMKIFIVDDLRQPIERQMGMDWVAEQAYKMANSMMTAREGNKK